MMLPWLLMPLIGALIGYATNWLAIKMLFHPRRPRFGFQGLLPRRQEDLARSVGEVVRSELVRDEELFAPLRTVSLAETVGPLIDEVIQAKATELRAMPLIGAFIKPEMLDGLRRSVVEAIAAREPQLKEQLIVLASERINVSELARQRIASFDLARLEAVILRVAARELRAITWWGAVLGALIGGVQALGLHLGMAAL